MLTSFHRYWLRFLAISTLVALVTTISGPVLLTHLAAQEAVEATPVTEAEADATLGGDDAPAGDDTVTFIAVADAYVLEEAPEDNFGDEPRLITDEELYSSSYIRFEVTGVTRVVEQATLRLWVLDSTGHAPTLWLAPSVEWSEEEVTWNSRPALDREIENKERGEVEEGEWLEYDVTSAVTGNGVYTFVLVPESTDGMDVTAREAPEDKPELALGLGEATASSDPMASGEAPVLLAAGDIASCNNDGDELTAKLLDEQPGFIAMLGDAAYPDGTEQEFKDCYDPTWGRHKDRTMPAVGNHEYNTDNAEPYFDYFGPVAGAPDEGFYSYDLGIWHVVVLNTNINVSAGSPQELWLREDLAANPAQCTLAYSHQPRFSSGEHGSTPSLDALYTALYEHGVEVLLSGHDHSYERFAPQDPEGEADLEYGIRQFVVGTGGIPLRSFSEFQPNSEVRTGEAHGVLRLQLYSDGYDWEFLSVEGSTFYDSGRGYCHDVPDLEDGDESGQTVQPVWASSDSRRSQRLAGRHIVS